jgi:hypothetical protein
VNDVVVEAVIAEALIKLRPWLQTKPRWWQITLQNAKESALRDYLFAVLQTALARMIGEQWLPEEAEAMARLDATVERAIAATEHPDVAAAAARYRDTLRDRWRAGYLAAVAMRATCGWPWLITGPATRKEATGKETGGENPPAEATDQATLTGHGSDDRELLVAHRARLLEEYKAATGASEYAIYNARGHTAHKSEFYMWKTGMLPPESATTKNLERFLLERKPPQPRASRRK